MLVVARVIRTIAGVIAGVVVLGILLVVLDANEDNTLVDAILDVGRWLADPFRGIFTFDDKDLQIAVNWGIAAVVYLAIGALLAALIVRAAARRRT